MGGVRGADVDAGAVQEVSTRIAIQVDFERIVAWFDRYHQEVAGSRLMSNPDVRSGARFLPACQGIRRRLIWIRAVNAPRPHP